VIVNFEEKVYLYGTVTLSAVSMIHEAVATDPKGTVSCNNVKC
jgi:hypothetical protein